MGKQVGLQSTCCLFSVLREAGDAIWRERRTEIWRRAIEEAETAYLSELLEIHQGRINQVAVSAGVTTRQIHKLMKKYAIPKQDFRGTENSA